MNINISLDKLITKYKIDSFYPQVAMRKKAEELLNTLIKDLSKDKTIALRGAGIHSDYVLNALDASNRKKISFMIDKFSKEKGEDIPIFEVDKIPDLKIDTIIISSFANRFDMAVELYNMQETLNFHINIIDLYSYFQLNDLNFQNCYYTDTEFGYKEIYCVRKQYLKEENLQRKGMLLEQLIYLYLYIKDFYYAQKYIIEYIQNNFERKEEYKQFHFELVSLLEEIEIQMHRREGKDIIINWMDALKTEELQDMPHLFELSKKSVFFDHAYTVMPWTSMTLASMMTNQYPIEGRLFQIKQFNRETSVFLDKLEKRNYKFQYLGEFKQVKKFAPAYRNKMIKKNIGYLPCCSYQWEVINTILNSERPVCILAHNLLETHTPFLNGHANLLEFKSVGTFMPQEISKNLTSQMNESKRYLDIQLHWYRQFYDNCTLCYMSDHGKFTRQQYTDNAVHINFFWYQKNVERNRYQKLFSLKDFSFVIESILDSKPFTKFETYIRLEGLDTYNKTAVETILNNCSMEEMKEYLQYTGIRTEKEKYIRNSQGDEVFYLLPDEEQNQINNEMYQDRIDSLRKITGDCFIDIFAEDFFVESRRIYNTVLRRDKA
ncbi:alkaline phosphatase family protein [Anaerosacchariphilus polymeriproducens]|uniref:Sulfatase N-terminal domain-containing protein n=1 Tax=Anaerosacchariphilus polymeriproducens TaxID=1812858 RepID=A0A371ATA7_9FIRM|nr:hypothetical protein [Anaerosacchariphilus polymeriproducens]RDU22801.1 hypothetical protein DWV06_12700 [Anaerosacchariphilus polymeriproducens]